MEDDMSAYIVDRSHINYMVQAALSRMLHPGHSNAAWVWNINHKQGTYSRNDLHKGDYKKATEVGQMLWDENIKSVHGRYPDDALESLPGPVGENYAFEFRFNHNIEIRPIQVLKAIDCYEYQSCEHSGWEESEAYAFIQSLRKDAIRALPEYDNMKWEFCA
jgi:hypothetical protein